MRTRILLVFAIGCGSVSAPQTKDAPPVCVPESDTEFCVRLDKTCEAVANMDNCGQARSANCGTCSGNTSACVANVCTAPVCGTTFTSPGTVVPSVNVQARQSALLGASTSGQSVLYLQATGVGSPCVGGGAALTIGDEAVAGTQPYVIQNITAVANLAGFSRIEETMTLSSDGLTIIGVATGNRSFLASHRSAVTMIDFSLAAAGDFATINAALPASPASVSWPVISADGLAFYYQVAGATDTTMNGIYESVRASATVAFPAATKMPAAVQAFEAISGMSSDRMTAFVAMSFGTHIMTRSSLSAPFTVPAASTPPTPAFRVLPIGGCTALGTTEPGGCGNEAIATWLNH
jgi:hypothetical protein